MGQNSGKKLYAILRNRFRICRKTIGIKNESVLFVMKKGRMENKSKEFAHKQLV